MFIQIIQGRCRDADRIHQLIDEWRDTIGATAEGWLGGTYGVTDEDEFVAVVRFDSREAAATNSDKPEQGEWWVKMQACFEGQVSCHDCDNAMMFLSGGSDEAGFVQILQGRVSDPEKFRHLMEQPMDALQQLRPEIIGGSIALEPDGWFTQTVCFRSEEAAREGEHKDMPAELREQFEKEMTAMQDVKYLDLHQPWFSSSGR